MVMRVIIVITTTVTTTTTTVCLPGADNPAISGGDEGRGTADPRGYARTECEPGEGGAR